MLAAAGCGASLGSGVTTEEGFFYSADTRLSYALDVPKGGTTPYPVVVFGHGSGPDTKNEKKAWALRLTARGFATFRFDKRGVGDSDGEYRRGYADFERLSGDLVAAVELVAADDRFDPARIGIMGSSQAGWILPMVATRSRDVDYVIILSGPTVTVGQHNFWDDAADDHTLSIDHLGSMLDDFVPAPGDFDPRPFVERMSVPAIWMFGREDRIIPAPQSAEIIREIERTHGYPFTVVTYPNAGHGLRDVETGDRVDYWPELLEWLGSEMVLSVEAPGRQQGVSTADRRAD